MVAGRASASAVVAGPAFLEAVALGHRQAGVERGPDRPGPPRQLGQIRRLRCRPDLLGRELL